MSRGWESKNVESQQDLQQAKADNPASPSSSAPPTKTDRQRNIQVDAEQRRKLQALEMQRERILSERTSSPHRRSALTTALADIEEKLAELGWTVHL